MSEVTNYSHLGLLEEDSKFLATFDSALAQQIIIFSLSQGMRLYSEYNILCFLHKAREMCM